jgi:mannose-6-phosphate isomerase-like protein (cupin superfamily)
MKSDQLSFRPGFRLSVGNARSQAAVMVLPAGGKEGGPDNLHRGADQWLFVVEGTGVAIINGRKESLKPGKMLLIEAGDRHEIRNTGRSLLKSVSVYAPPAYRDEETELLDMTMLVMTDGQERTEAEYAVLLDKAGFRLSRVVPTTSAASVVEAVLA